MKILLATLAWLAVATSAWSQAYPNRAVKVVVPWPPGQATDIAARVVAERLQAALGQPFVVENRPGAGGSLGSDVVVKSAPDGYTLLAASSGPISIMPNLQGTPYSPLKDLAPVSLICMTPFALVAHPSFPAKDAKEFIAELKANPGKYTFASSGTGATAHLFAELFLSMAGVQARHVPYKGSAPALTDVMGGQASLMFDTMLSAMPQVKNGKLKAIAVTSAARSPAAPDVPTVAESGLPGYEAIAWNGLLAPAGTPAEVVNKLNAELKKALDAPDVKDRFSAQGFGAAWNTREAFAKFIQAELDKWAKVVKVSGATLD